eukprot:5095485-Prymnesium_polylepis.2
MPDTIGHLPCSLLLPNVLCARSGRSVARVASSATPAGRGRRRRMQWSVVRCQPLSRSPQCGGVTAQLVCELSASSGDSHGLPRRTPACRCRRCWGRALLGGARHRAPPRLVSKQPKVYVHAALPLGHERHGKVWRDPAHHDNPPAAQTERLVHVQ